MLVGFSNVGLWTGIE